LVDGSLRTLDRVLAAEPLLPPPAGHGERLA